MIIVQPHRWVLLVENKFQCLVNPLQDRVTAIKIIYLSFITAPILKDTISVNIILWVSWVGDFSNCVVLMHKKEIFTFMLPEAQKAIKLQPRLPLSFIPICPWELRER